MVHAVLAASVICQFAAAIFALKLIKTTGWRLVWALLAVAITLMAIRRSITLWRLLGGGAAPDLAAESVALFISLLMVCSIFLLAPLFHAHLRQKTQALKWEHIFLNADWGIAVSDATGMALESVNPSFAWMHGYTVEELTGRPVASVYAPALRPDVEEFVGRVRGKRHMHVETEHARRDGTVFPVSKDISVIQDAEGNLYHAAFVEDITERRRAEEALRKWDHVVQNAEWGIVTVDPETLALDTMNPTFARMHGYTVDELSGMPLATVYADSEAERVEENTARVRAKGNCSFEGRHKRKDGTEFTVSKSVSVVRGDEGRTLYFAAYVEDITERKRVEEALRERETRMRLLTEQIPAVLWTTDVNQRFTSSTGSGLKHLGLEPGQVVGMTLQEYFQTEDREFDSLVAQRRAIAGEAVTYDTVFAGRTWSSYVEPLRDEKGRITGAIGIALDITERKEAEEALRRSHEQLRSLAKRLQEVREEERTAIAREIHDEVGQAMTGVKLELAWLKDNLPPAAEKLKERAEATISLVDSTIDSARRLSSRLRPAVLDELGLEAALESLAREFGRRTGCDCSLSVDADDLGLDERRDTAVFRIVQEALTNVARHAAASRVEIRLHAAADFLDVEVEDDGPGIAEEEVSSPRSLGLIGMRERALSLGGEVDFRPAEGGGTVVRLRLPLAADEPAEIR